MSSVYVKLDKVDPINQQQMKLFHRNISYFETVKSKVIVSLFQTVRLFVSILPRNLNNSLESIKENYFQFWCLKCLQRLTNRLCVQVF